MITSSTPDLRCEKSHYVGVEYIDLGYQCQDRPLNDQRGQISITFVMLTSFAITAVKSGGNAYLDKGLVADDIKRPSDLP